MQPNPLKEAIKKAGGVRAVAGALDLSTQSIYSALWGRTEPGEKLLAHLGLERVVTYRPRRKRKAS